VTAAPELDDARSPAEDRDSDGRWTLPGRLRAFARTRGDRPALRNKELGIWKTIDWEEYWENCAVVGRMLWHLGVRKGDHVAILSDNRPEWLYADLDGTGNGYDPDQAGDLTVHPSGDVTPPAAPTNLQVTEASPSFISLAWDAVADDDLYRYEVYRSDTSGGSYAKIAEVLAPATEVTDWNVTAEATYYYVVLAVDTSFNASGYSNEVEATAEARSVAVTFNATLPDTTPDGDDIYVAGSFNAWDPAGTLMDRTDLSATVTITLDEGTQIEYKYTRGSWTYVEKGAECEEISNRTATVVYGADGTMTLDDTVLNWRNTGPCGN